VITGWITGIAIQHFAWGGGKPIPDRLAAPIGLGRTLNLE
jgi:hypothetical protein